ncbi:helix-turn-helix domain-containing protein [Streptomyces olivoreticuli]
MEIGVLLMHCRSGLRLSEGHDWTRSLDRALDGRLPLLSSLHHGYRGYLPDFITPQPTGHFDGVETELHQVATASTSCVAREMNTLLHGAPWGQVCNALPRNLRDTVELGEHSFAQRIAEELDLLWQRMLAPHWPTLISQSERDIGRRAELTARHGLTTTLGSLHRRVAFHDGVLALSGPFQTELEATAPLILVPSAVAVDGIAAGIDLSGARGPYLVYPAHRPRQADRTAGPPLSEVLGHTRLELLQGLGRPRSTTELAGLHHLTPATVSYHLTRLHRAGFLTRFRDGHRVLYQRSPQASRLLHEAGPSGV